MARSHFTLAALATSAVPALDVAAAAAFGSVGRGDFDSALVTDREGQHFIVRVPRNPRAEREQDSDLAAIRALSAGVRARLPFSVSSFAGSTPVASTRAIVYEFLYGSKAPLSSYGTGPDSLAASVGSAIGAIHSLPTSFISDAGLPVQSTGDGLRACITVMDRASATGLMPAALLSRWERATEDAKLWQFQPTVIHGDLSSDSILSDDGQVTGVLGWQELRVGDPARDLQWVLAASNPAIGDTVFGAYERVRGVGDRQLRQRAKLYSELEVAKWLLHGTETRDTAIVDDAVAMLTNLAEAVGNDVMNPLSAHTMPTMAIDDLEAFLDRTERAV
ncbi:MAG: phosphotransferase [Rhodoglobus sp.]